MIWDHIDEMTGIKKSVDKKMTQAQDLKTPIDMGKKDWERELEMKWEGK